MEDTFITPSEMSGWAGQLIEAVGGTNISTGSAIGWLETNLGLLNSHLWTDFYVEDSHITPAMNSLQSGIYNEMFFCNWLRKKSRTMIGSLEYDWVEMIGESQGKIKVVSNSEKSSSYKELAKDCQQNLKDLIKAYRGGDFIAPKQITMNDRFSSPIDIYSQNFTWSSINPVTEL